MAELNFDIGAKYREAASAFKELAGGVDAFQRKLKELDRTKANPKIDLVLKEAQAKLKKFQAELDNLRNVQLQVDADTAKANADIRSVERELKQLRDTDASVEVTARTKIAETRLKQLKAERDKLKDVRLTVTADIAAANANIAGLNSSIGRIERDIATIATVDVDTSKADRQVGAFTTQMRARIAAAIKALPEIELTADSSDADRSIARLRAQLETLADPRVTPNFNDAGVRAQIAALSAQLRALSAQDVDIEANFNATAALAQMAVLRRTMGDTGSEGNSLFRTLGAVGGGFSLLASGVGSAVSGLGSLIGSSTKAGSAMTSLGSSISGVGGSAGSMGPTVASAAAAFAQMAISAAPIVGILSLVAGAGAVLVAGLGQLGGAFIALASGIVPLVGNLGLLPGLLLPIGLAAGAVAIAFGDAGLKKEVENLKTAFGPLVTDIRDQLRPAMTGLLQSVAALVPTFRAAAPAITSAIADVSNQFSNMFRSSSFQADLRSILTESSVVIRDFGATAQSGVRAFMDIMIAAQPVVEQLTLFIRNGAAEFANWTAQARRSGELTTFFSQAFAVFRDLVGVVGNLTGLFKDFWDSANRTGAFTATLGAINDGITRFRDYVNDAGGAWDRLMAKAGPATASLVRMVESIGKAFVEMGANVDVIPLFDRISAAITNLTPTFEGIAQKAVPAFEKIVAAGEKLMIAIGPEIGDIITKLAGAFEALAPSLETIIPFLGRMAVEITKVIAVVGNFIDNLVTLAEVTKLALSGDFSGAKAAWDGLQERQRRHVDAMKALGTATSDAGRSAEAAATQFSGVGAAIESIPPGKQIPISLDTSSMNADTQAAIAYINSVPPNWFTRFTGDMINLGAVAVMAQTEVGKVPEQHSTALTGVVDNLLSATQLGTAAVNGVPPAHSTALNGVVDSLVSATQLGTSAINGVPLDHNTAIMGDAGSAVGEAGRATGAINGVPDRSDTAINAQDNASGVIRSIIDWYNRIPRTVRTVIETVNRIVNAEGGIVTPMAAGGLLPMADGDAFDRMRPMSGRTARIVPPNTPRVIGDRMVDDEAFIPINDSAWSTAILAETARRKDFQLVPMARGGFSGDPRDERAWEWIRRLLEGLRGRPGGGGPRPGPIGGVGGPAGSAPMGQLQQSTLRTAFATTGGMASMTRANPLYSALTAHTDFLPGERGFRGGGGAVKVDFSNLSFRMTGNQLIDNLLEEVARAIRARGGDPQQFFGYR